MRWWEVFILWGKFLSIWGFLLGVPSFAFAAAAPVKEKSPSDSREQLVNLGGVAPLLFTADRTKIHVKENRLEAVGNVFVAQESLRLIADRAELDRGKKTLRAFGNVVFTDGSQTLRGDELSLDLVTKTGVVNFGEITKEAFVFKGRRISRWGENKYSALECSYTTCRDTPPSWMLVADSGEVEVGGYAFLRHVFIHINDVPFIYLPYFIAPVKTERQSGLLFPRFGSSSNHGFVFMQPFFWAISPQQDATITAGFYNKTGNRVEAEHRYVPNLSSSLTSTGFLTQDRQFQRKYGPGTRWAFNHSNYLSLDRYPRAYFTADYHTISDSRYPVDYNGDTPGMGMPALRSSFLTAYRGEYWVPSVDARLYRDLLGVDPLLQTDQPVQVLPRIQVGSVAHPIFGFGDLWSMESRLVNFTRNGDSFSDLDRDGKYNDQTETIRTVRRLSLIPKLAVPMEYGPFRYQPSVKAVGSFYELPAGDRRRLSRQLIEVRNNASLGFDKIYGWNVAGFDAFKHIVRFYGDHRYVPYVKQSNSGFFQRSAFDQEDLEAEDNTATFGINQRFISRLASPLLNLTSYRQTVEFDSSIPWNIRAYQRAKRSGETTEKTYGPLSNLLSLNYPKFTLSANHSHYFYSDPGVGAVKQRYQFYDIRRNTFGLQGSYFFYGERPLKEGYRPNLTFAYTLNKRENDWLKQTEEFKLTFLWLWNDTIATDLSQTWSFAANTKDQIIAENYTIHYLSPSQCWRLSVNFSRGISETAFRLNFALPINFTGRFENFFNYAPSG